MDGAIISEPMVNEPIEGGILQIPARDAAALGRARTLAAREC
jgi:hypothetical protein